MMNDLIEFSLPSHIEKLNQVAMLTPQEMALREAIIKEYEERVALEEALMVYLEEAPKNPFSAAHDLKEFLTQHKQE